MDVAQIKRVNATGDVTTVTSYLRSATLTAGADNATATIRSGGVGGTVVLVLKAPSPSAVGETVTVDLGGAACCPGGIHVTVAGTTPDVTLVYS
jgi:hypothetical protein